MKLRRHRRRSLWYLSLLVAALFGCGDKKPDQKPHAPLAPPTPATPKAGPVQGWLHWRGPHQTGVSDETGLPKFWEGAAEPLWTKDLAGRGAPVAAGDRLYVWGYRSVGQSSEGRDDVEEVVACLEADTGKTIWEHTYRDYLSDIIYNRYSIGSPTIDPATGWIYVQVVPGTLVCLTPDGKEEWSMPLLERYGRLALPNGRVGAPVIDDDLVIVHGVTANWGRQGPGRDRFYAFDKKTGEPVWVSQPGIRPKDGCFSSPFLAWHGDRRVLYSGTGCGNVVAVNARNGDPLWRIKVSLGGVNASVLLHDDKLIVIHGKEKVGNMMAIRLPELPAPGAKPLVLGDDAVLWKNDLYAFTSSPILVGDRIYQTDGAGSLSAVDVNTGKVLWKLKLDTEQRHASPLYADGHLFVPMVSGNLYVIKPGEKAGTIVKKIALDGKCFGPPAVWNGKLYVFTTKKLYCFGRPGAGKSISVTAPAVAKRPAPGKPVRLQIIPTEVLLRAGDTQTFRIRSIDANGLPVSWIDPKEAAFEKWIPATAKVRVKLSATVDDAGRLTADKVDRPSAGAFRVTHGGLVGTFRGRTMPALPMREDFESFNVSVQHKTEQSVTFGYPPLAWIGARFKWEVRNEDAGAGAGARNNVFTKTIDRLLFQRALTYIGHPDLSNYTIAIDVKSDSRGRRRRDRNRPGGQVGLICQRYLVVMKYVKPDPDARSVPGIEISSNLERLRVAQPFHWEANKWYRLKATVRVNADGSGVVKAKAWVRGEPEPAAWTIEVPVTKAHRQGSPGLFGFAVNQRRVYIDNIEVTANR